MTIWLSPALPDLAKIPPQSNKYCSLVHISTFKCVELWKWSLSKSKNFLDYEHFNQLWHAKRDLLHKTKPLVANI